MSAPARPSGSLAHQSKPKIKSRLLQIRHGRRHHRKGPSPRTGRKRGTPSQAIGRSKGGMTTKILALTDALGNLVRFVLLPGFDTVGVAPLIDDLAFEGFIADKALRQQFLIATSTSAAPRSSSHSIHGAPRLCRSTLRSTSGATDREFLWQPQRIQTRRNASRQNRSEFRRTFSPLPLRTLDQSQQALS